MMMEDWAEYDEDYKKGTSIDKLRQVSDTDLRW